MFEIDYDEPLFRPPSEAYSLILQVTLGCSWNRCAFCEMYRSKRFSLRNHKKIRDEIQRVAAIYPGVRKIFLADGNAMVLSSQRLLAILTSIKESFPNVQRVSTYALPKDILAKSLDQLRALREAGLQLVYVGIESGDDEVLRMINKGESADSTVAGLLKAKEAGIDCSVMIINGLAGLKYSQSHAVNSAKILNKIQPRFFSTLVLTLPWGIETYKKSFDGIYIPMDAHQLLREMEILIENTGLNRTIFRTDHASNFLVLKGVLSRDKEEILKTIRSIIGETG